jgi:ribosomal protein L9
LHVEQIKTLGTYSVAVKLHSDVEFPVNVEVVKA